MVPIYLHKLTVTVITTECSPDAIERVIDKAGSDAGMRIDARTDAENRMRGPSIQVADPPSYPPQPSSKADEQRWADAHDAWLDSWPRLEDFKA